MHDRLFIESKEETVATVCTLSQADAALIAAAPDLLAALRYVLSENPHYCASPLVHAAIAKAEGK